MTISIAKKIQKACSINAFTKRKTNRTNKNGFTGVKYRKSCDRYYAIISINNKKTFIGSYKTAKEAGEAYLKARKMLDEMKGK